MLKKLKSILVFGSVVYMLAGCSSIPQEPSNVSQKQIEGNKKSGGPSCYDLWDPTTIYVAGGKVSYNNINYKVNWWTTGSNPSTNNGGIGTGQPFTIDSPCVGTAPIAPKAPVLPKMPSIWPPVDPGTTANTIDFHLLLGASAVEDQLVLTDGKYNDLIMSNIIAGVMYGHLVQEFYPGLQYDKDYLYGSIFGQLLQENIATQAYDKSGNQIDRLPSQSAVMGIGQGGPYQINNYSLDMVANDHTPVGHALFNYIAIQKNIGYTRDTAAEQYGRKTPPSFNDKYYAPMLTAYFHYNDFVSLILVCTDEKGKPVPWKPAYSVALTNFKTLPNGFLDIILNVAYNQGYYGALTSRYSELGATTTSATIASVNSYNTVWGINDSYEQYPYQVRYYLDQLYNKPIPSTSAKTFVTPNNHVAFDIAALEAVFSKVFQTLAYVDSAGNSVFISAAQAQTAYASALTKSGVAGGTKLDLGNVAERAQIFGLLEEAISILETNLNTKFNATVRTQL